VVGVANALVIPPFAGHGFDGVFAQADDGHGFAVNLYEVNVRDDSGAGDLFALVDPALNGFGLNAHTNDLPCIVDTNQHAAALGIGKRGQGFDDFFLKAAFKLNNHRLKPEGLDYGLEVLIRVD
jgi:hypothetical protein